MRILVIGGTGFIGPHLVRQLALMGHSVDVSHRGGTQADFPAGHILGDRRDLAALRPQAFRGVAHRVVAASSIDVYRAFDVLHGGEEGPLEPVPLTEDSPLHTRLGDPDLPGTMLRLPMIYGPGGRLGGLSAVSERAAAADAAHSVGEERAQVDPRGPGGPPHNLCRIPQGASSE